MDVFSLVKFWRNAGIGDPLTSTNLDIISDDESSFFDLVFTNNNNNDQCVDSTTINIISDFHSSDHYQQQQEGCFSNMDGLDTKSKSNQTYYPCSSPHSIFFNKSKILPLDSSSTTKSPKSPFRVLKLGFQNKMKHETRSEIKCDDKQVTTTISSLLKRDNSSFRNKLVTSEQDHDHSSKRFSKQVVYKYLNIIKPSKRFHDKVRLPDNSSSSPATTSIFSPRKYLGKSRSSSSSSAAVKPVPLPALRRDDSALQQQDGIQSAILHCKKSYSSSSPSRGCQVLSRSGSAPSHGARISVDEKKRSSI
uniref:membrane-associated kinase regulator 5-like n=1 Tax=Erigeron canadensis TaxID=72917 RepID=UPI001CB8F54C|nr:membrane-associated kinase regulator 5-like [Erigeron canadensis]